MLHEQALDIVMAASPDGPAVMGAPLLDVSSTWVNELGSRAEFTFGAGGALTGTYTSMVSGGGGSVSGPIVGWYNGVVIAWSVLWPTGRPAITCWTGEVVRGPASPVIETLWYMTTQTPTPGDPTQFWTAVNAGADSFQPQ